jgi:hypothetical protein
MTEVECIAAFEAAKEVAWIRNFVSELGVVPSCPVLWISIMTIVEP